MLIFCCGMPRSGGTLLYQLTKEIAERRGLGRGHGFPKQRFRSGVVKTDTCQDWMVNRVVKGKAIAFGTYRDFRDIAVSLRRFYSRREVERGKGKPWTIDDVFRHRPDILDIYYCWQPHTTWFRYEDENLAETIVNKVSGVLGVSFSNKESRAIIDKYSLGANERRIKNQQEWMDAGGGSMLVKIHISPTRGRSTWREALSKKDLAKVEAIGGDWLAEHGYK